MRAARMPRLRGWPGGVTRASACAGLRCSATVQVSSPEAARQGEEEVIALSRIGVLVVVIAALTPTLEASAATAPVTAPVLTSAVFASPVTIHWTPPFQTISAVHG